MLPSPSDEASHVYSHVAGSTRAYFEIKKLLTFLRKYKKKKDVKSLLFFSDLSNIFAHLALLLEAAGAP